MFEISVNEEGVVTISGSLTIGHIEALYVELSKIFNEGTCTTLDLSDVSEIDVAALQVFMAFKKSLLEINRSVGFIAGEAVQETIGLSGFKKLFKAA